MTRILKMRKSDLRNNCFNICCVLVVTQGNGGLCGNCCTCVNSDRLNNTALQCGIPTPNSCFRVAVTYVEKQSSGLLGRG